MSHIRLLSKNMFLQTCCSLMIILSLSACAHKVSFRSSEVVPAAKGYTKLTHDKNKNYVLNVYVSNLAGPERLTPPKAVYVVWLKTEQSGIKNVGQLKISSKLDGSLKAITPFSPVEIFITAEDYANVQVPSSGKVLSSMTF